MKTQVEVLAINVQHLKEELKHKDVLLREQFQTIEDLKVTNKSL